MSVTINNYYYAGTYYEKSDGDLQMLHWTAAGNGKRLMVYIHNTDVDRDWAYDRESSIGRLNKELDKANAKGCIVVDMKMIGIKSILKTSN
jgi:hypothetical protein